MTEEIPARWQAAGMRLDEAQKGQAASAGVCEAARSAEAAFNSQSLP